MKKTLLILAANPTNTKRLHLSKEIREIKGAFKDNDEFILEIIEAARFIDLQNELPKIRPNYVHFTGIGEGEKGIAFEDDKGKSHLISAEILEKVFEPYADIIENVTLMATYSAFQARSIAKYTKYAVGIIGHIGDLIARAYSTCFYSALSRGNPIIAAHKLACDSITAYRYGVPLLFVNVNSRIICWCEENVFKRMERLQQEELLLEIPEVDVVDFFTFESYIAGYRNNIDHIKALQKIQKELNVELEGRYDLNEKGQVTDLNLSSCHIVNLTPIISPLKSLNTLDYLNLNSNKIKELLPLECLNWLTELNLWNNQVEDISILKKLNKLKGLDLGLNQIKDISPLKSLERLQYLYLHGNPIENPPPEVWTQGIDAIKNYWKFLEKDEEKPLNEAKLLIVGQGGVGKTSLVNRLVRNIFNDHENKTEGINIETWKIKINNENIRLNIWDFGGQEIMHATHQFFLTKRSVYLLVLDARQGKEHNRIEYWLKLIQSFGGDSPILIAINKTDQQPLDINRKYLKSKYPTIKAFFDISCKTAENLEKLADSIKNTINELPHVHDPFPSTWFAVKENLENMSQDFIEYNEYEKICENKEIDKSSQHTLIGFLHDLGIVLNFREDTLRPQLKDIGILNPEWVTEGIYKLLNSFDLFQSKGILDVNQLSALLNSIRYPKKNHRIIMDLMEKFELCFEFPDYKNRFLIPELLSEEEVDVNWNFQDSLSFEFHYDILPNSIISRFIVKMQDLISKKTYWRTGVVLADEHNKALIKADIEDKKIFIWVSGNAKTRRGFLHTIRQTLKSIHKTISKIQAVEKVPYKNSVIDYQHLLTLEELGEETFIPEGMKERVNIAKLLEGVDNRAEKENHGNVYNIFTDNSRHFENSGEISHSNANLGDNDKQTISDDSK